MSHTLSQHRSGRLDSHKCRRVKVRMGQCTPNKQDQIRYKHCSVESESCITYKSCWEQSINRHRTGYRHQPTQVLGIRTYLLNLQKSYWHMLCKQKHLYSYCTLLHNIQCHHHSVCPFHRHNHRSYTCSRFRIFHSCIPRKDHLYRCHILIYKPYSQASSCIRLLDRSQKSKMLLTFSVPVVCKRVSLPPCEDLVLTSFLILSNLRTYCASL